MGPNFIPRFYYALPFTSFLKGNAFHSANSKIESIKSNANQPLYSINGRTGLRILLSSIGKENLKVGIQAYTCHTVLQAIRKAGHQAVFIDITNDYKLDTDDLKKKSREIDVLIVTHTFGFPDDIDRIKNIVVDKIIIEDCAHSFLSKYKGEYTGILGDAAIFSTGLAKFPPVGSGGFCVINTPQKFPLINAEFEEIPQTGKGNSVIDFTKILVYSIMMKRPFYGLVTYPLGKKLDKRMDFVNKYSFPEYTSYPWAKRIFECNNPFFRKMLKKQKENAELLSSLLTKRDPVMEFPEENEPNFFIFPLLIDGRDDLFDKCLKNNIEAGKHFSRSIEWASEFGYRKGECPNAELIVRKIITVPVHYGVSSAVIKKIAALVNESSL